MQGKDEEDATRGLHRGGLAAGLGQTLRDPGRQSLALIGQVERIGDGFDLGDQAFGAGVGACHGEGDARGLKDIQRFLRAGAGFRQDQVGVQGQHAFG